ncbi:glutamate-1-semialdehyde 2,1-aminomutase [candidate division KSB3 bacterium]|uniref:Glutamate-1-semialdehyde 2,1-aminomutase n=1 Tax=candidate division KSB3 bacterium TaxID=2044937 RepID=A0A9D5Q474_9BACT|nr:glutamate-1-semialdehyde 2,1-aminomutase [candidate division KSB3 bacterium]MBD3323429.1 glutamate-1-semialdehyde 2,1-aminomutase [candidate division KSB3 bacterium]
MMKATPRSEQLFERAVKSIPGGVNSPVRAFKSVNRNPLFIQRAEGSKIYDVDGNAYIDFVNSWGPLLLGHSHPRVKEAVLQAVQDGTSYGAPTEKEIILAELIVEMVPSVDMVRLVNSGTEATMSAVRLARAFTGRDKIVKIEGCYHGHGDSFLIKAGSGATTFGEPNSPGVTTALAQDTLIVPYNDVAAVRQIFDQYSGDIAALILEPVAANMGVIPPEQGYLKELRAITSQHNSLLIFDEVITGFRLSNGGAQEYYGVLPDLTTLGKIIGGGLPIGAYGGRRDIMDMMSPTGPVYQAGTLSGNPIAVSAGIATLQYIKEAGVIETVNAKADRFFKAVGEIIQAASRDLWVNHIGSMSTLFFQQGPVKNYHDATRSDTAQFAAFFNSMLDHGISLAPSQFEAMFISLAHTDEDLEKTLEALKMTLSG